MKENFEYSKRQYEEKVLKPAEKKGAARVSRIYYRCSNSCWYLPDPTHFALVVRKNIISKFMLEQAQNSEYLMTMNRVEVKHAIFVVQKAKETKESISRKLSGGSSAVTVQDLAIWESELNDGMAALLALTKKYPLLISHPYLEGFTIPA